jgi:hypothetical protein
MQTAHFLGGCAYRSSKEKPDAAKDQGHHARL